MDDIFIRELKMPLSIKAFTTIDYNGDYNIFINANLSDDAKRLAFRHEKIHIERGDFYSCELATELENSMKKGPYHW
jgi:Zn-dependent peptidase ImmA (M78 family)